MMWCTGALYYVFVNIMYCPRTVIGDEERLNVVKCKMTDEYRHEIESGEMKEWGISQK